MNSAEYFERAKKVAPGGVHSPVRSFKGMDRSPVFFKSAHGCHLTSVEGKEYIDYCMSFGPLMLGHRHPDVAKVVHHMIDTAWTFGACEAYSLELAEWIIKEIPWVEKLRFVSSGTEAVMSALRVARAATKRSKILKFEGCYHGHVDSMLVKSGSGLAGEASTSSDGVPPDVANNTLVAPLDDDKMLEQIFVQRGAEIAAVVIEPLPANYGLLPQRIEFLKLIETLCRKYGALLIFDEVISGFRVALGGVAQLTGIHPDLVTYGKVIGGGFPVGCYGGKKKYLDLVAPLGPVYQAGTLSANPVGMAAGLQSLKIMKEMNIWNVLEKRTQNMATELRKNLAQLKKPLQVSAVGSLFWIHASTTPDIRRVDQIPGDQAVRFRKLFLGCLERGVYLAPNAYEVGILSAAHTDEIVSQTVQIISEVAREVDRSE